MSNNVRDLVLGEAELDDEEDDESYDEETGETRGRERKRDNAVDDSSEEEDDDDDEEEARKVRDPVVPVAKRFSFGRAHGLPPRNGRDRFARASSLMRTMTRTKSMARVKTSGSESDGESAVGPSAKKRPS